MKLSLLFSMFLIPVSAFAFNYPYILRSPKALLMGDAFTAVNDDEYTLFYNPASLGRHKYDLTLNPFSSHLSATNLLADMDKLEDVPDTPAGFADLLMDYPVHAGVGVAPGFKLFNFALTYIASDSYDILVRNKAHPMMDLDIRSDRGVAFGLGVPLGPNRISKKSQSGSQTNLGFGAKYIKRTGIQDQLALSGPTVVDGLGQDEINDLVKSLGQASGDAWGFDAALEHVVRSGNGQFVLALSALDITGTEFKVKSNADNLKVANIDDQFNLGLAVGHDFPLFHYILSADIRALNEQMDFANRLRLGGQIGIPGITLMAGLNSGYYSYGAELDLLFMKLSVGFYDVELGSKYKQTQGKRFILYLSLFDFSFDA
jgi:hypothetical protein